MPWSTLTVGEVVEEFNDKEKSSLDAIKGNDALIGIVARTTQKVRDCIRAGNYPLGDDGTIPDGLKRDAIAMARWVFLISVAKNEALQTQDRRKANDQAEELMEKIANMDYAIEPPSGGDARSGNWNSENKLIMRTHPVPRSSTQGQSTITGPPYSNPNAPPDN